MKITLYTGPHCELCDQAQALIAQLDEPVELDMVNIRNSTDLYHLYGARIPVIKKTSDVGIETSKNTQINSSHSPSNELGWPFSLIQLRAFLV